MAFRSVTLLALLAFSLSGCAFPFSSRASSDELLQSVDLQRIGNKTQPNPALDLSKVVFEEWTNEVKFVFVLGGAPNLSYGLYACDARQPGLDLVSESEVRPRERSRVRDVLVEGSQLTLGAAYSNLTALTWAPQWNLTCSVGAAGGASRAADGGTTPNTVFLHTEIKAIRWKILRQLGDRAAVFGVGPFYVATKVGTAPCCHVARNQPTAGTTVTTVDDPPNDLLELWMWQNATGLFVQTVTAKPPRPNAHESCSYDGPLTPGANQKQALVYGYSTGEAHSEPAGAPVRASIPAANVLRFFATWDDLAHRRHDDRISVLCIIWSTDAQGNDYVDSVDMPDYHLR